MNSIKKKILFINGHLNIGGIERSLVDLLNNLDNTIYDVDLLLLEGTGTYINQIPSYINVINTDTKDAIGPFLNIFIHNIRNYNISNIMYRLITNIGLSINKKILKYLRPILGIAPLYDCAISYRGGFYTDLLVYTVNSKKKICWWHHGECIYNKDSIQKINKTWEQIDTIIAVSHGCKNIILSNFKYPSSKIQIIPNMVNIEMIQLMANHINPYPKDKINIVTVATFTPEKHLEDIIDITSLLIKNNISNFNWHIIGDGILYDIIKSKIINHHLEKYIILHGRKSNPYPYIKHADLYVHTSYIESQCIAVLEAMTLKVPCIVCESLGPKEYIKNGYNGFWVSHDINSITDCIIRVLMKRHEIDEIKENAYTTVIQNFSPKIIKNKFNNLINEYNK